MNCPNCGTFNNLDSKFCAKCGKAFSTSQPQPVNQNMNMQSLLEKQSDNLSNEHVSSGNKSNNFSNNTNYQNYNTRNNKKKIFLVIAALLIVVIIVFIAYKIFGKNSGTLDIFDSDQLIRVQKDDKYGYIDSDGNFVIEPIYDYATSFYGDYAITTITEDDKEDEVYQVIDKKGNVKATAISYLGIEYISDYNVWVINYQLYDTSLKKISSDNVAVDYEDYGYLRWGKIDGNTAGIMDVTGKIIYTYKLQEDDYFSFDPSDIDETLTERYCRVNINNEEYGIINCDTGKLIYDYGNYYISVEDDNIFSIKNPSNYDLISTVYIEDDEVVYQNDGEDISLHYNSDGYIQIRDYSKDFFNRYSYYILETGEVVTERPSSNNQNISLDEWEELTGIVKNRCDTGYGLMKNDETVLSCEWDNIRFFDITLYQYLKENGKDYVMTQKNNKFYIVNLKDGQTVAEFNASSVFDSAVSPFIHYIDLSTNEIVIYNLITGKSITTNRNNIVGKYSNYMTISENGKLYYYNNNLELIYTEEQ